MYNKTSNSPYIQVNVLLTKPQKEKLKKLHINVSELVRSLINEFLEKMENGSGATLL